MKRGEAVRSHFDGIAKDYDFYKAKNKYYYDNLKKLLKSLIPPGKRVLEIGCGTGDLLASLKPKIGYGMDLSSEMIKQARRRYKSEKNLHFSTKLLIANRYSLDAIFMSDVIEHLEDPKGTFQKISKLMDKNSLFVNTMANPVWEPLLMFWEHRGWKMPEGPHKRIGYKEIKTVMTGAGLKIIRHDYRLLIPVKIPLITEFANRHLEKYLKRFAFIEYFVAKTA